MRPVKRWGIDIDIDAAELARRLQLRDDVLVLERRSDLGDPEGDHRSTQSPERTGSARFEALEGPYRSYERVVEWEPTGDTTFRFRQFVRFWPALPVFGPMYFPLMRRALQNPMRKGRRPFWALPDRLSPEQATVVAVMCIFHVVGGMLFAFLSNVLTFASADLGNGTAGQQSMILAVARIGVIITIVTMAVADKVGRRRIAIWAASIAATVTVACALSPNLLVLTGLQTVSRNLAIAAMLAADTISVEELPAGSRAAAQGLGALSYGLGAGMVVVALPLADLGAAGWRLVFAVAAVSAPLIYVGARHLPESTRFMTRDSSPAARRISPARFALIGSLLFLLNAFLAPSSQLQNDYLRADRGFDGSRITLFVLVTSGPALFGIVMGGRLADRRGRRAAIIPGLVSLAVFGAAFFVFSGFPMWMAATLTAVFGTIGVPAIGVLAPELFPTARRGATRGGLTGVATAGSVAGLLIAGVLVDSLGYGQAFVWLGAALLVAAALAMFVPETAGIELEELNERRRNLKDPSNP